MSLLPSLQPISPLPHVLSSHVYNPACNSQSESDHHALKIQAKHTHLMSKDKSDGYFKSHDTICSPMIPARSPNIHERAKNQILTLRSPFPSLLFSRDPQLAVPRPSTWYPTNPQRSLHIHCLHCAAWPVSNQKLSPDSTRPSIQSFNTFVASVAILTTQLVLVTKETHLHHFKIITTYLFSSPVATLSVERTKFCQIFHPTHQLLPPRSSHTKTTLSTSQKSLALFCIQQCSPLNLLFPMSACSLCTTPDNSELPMARPCKSLTTGITSFNPAADPWYYVLLTNLSLTPFLSRIFANREWVVLFTRDLTFLSHSVPNQESTSPFLWSLKSNCSSFKGHSNCYVIQ